MTVPISVIVPIGPLRRHSEFLLECLESINAQTEPPDEIVLVDDSGTFDLPGELDCPCASNIPNRRIIVPDKVRGIAGGYNAGVEAARNELIFCMGSDDRLMVNCLASCYQAWEHYGHAVGWYFVAVEYSNGYSQNTPCLAAMIPKELFRIAGGPFKLDGEHNTAGCETEFIDRMLIAGGRLGSTYRVSDDILYWYRVHAPADVTIVK